MSVLARKLCLGILCYDQSKTDFRFWFSKQYESYSIRFHTEGSYKALLPFHTISGRLNPSAYALIINLHRIKI